MVLESTRSNILKLALFCTGLSGIVAEYILSTLATYFLGDSVFQWTMILSTMLFSMGLGSRISKFLEDYLLEKFIIIEFVLSILVSFSALLTYMAAAFTDILGVIIYTLSIAIGILIGMEIPLVTRLNEQFESLRVNIAAVMEKTITVVCWEACFCFRRATLFGAYLYPFRFGSGQFYCCVDLICHAPVCCYGWLSTAACYGWDADCHGTWGRGGLRRTNRTVWRAAQLQRQSSI